MKLEFSILWLFNWTEATNISDVGRTMNTYQVVWWYHLFNKCMPHNSLERGIEFQPLEEVILMIEKLHEFYAF